MNQEKLKVRITRTETLITELDRKWYKQDASVEEILKEEERLMIENPFCLDEADVKVRIEVVEGEEE